MRLWLLTPLLAACGTATIAGDTADTAEVVDECDATVSSTWYTDADGDGYGDEAVTALCQPDGTVAVDGDCDDDNEHTWPGAEDICDGRDNDCNGVADDGEAGTLTTWYGDADGDGYGHPAASSQGCSQPTGYVDTADDCDDNTGGVYPGAREIGAGAANDCDGDRASWVSDDGMATFTTTDEDTGETHHSDISDQLSLDGSAPAVLTLTTSGVLTLCDGTWHTRLILDADDITVIGQGGQEVAILDGGGAGPVVTVSAGYSASLEGLSLINGSAEAGGGLYVVPVDCSEEEKHKKQQAQAVTQPDIVLDELIISGNTATRGGGVYASGCVDLDIDDSLITDNAAEQGGGIYVGTDDEDEVDFYLDDSLVTDNTAEQGGGLWVGSSWALIFDSIIADNTATETGGGVQLSGYLYIATYSQTYVGITGNTATQGGGVYFGTDSSLYASEADWGGEADEETGKTAADNDPDDIFGPTLTDAPYAFGLGQVISCTDKGGCVVEGEEEKKK